MYGLLRTAFAALACTCLLGAAEHLQPRSESRCETTETNAASDTKPHASKNEEIRFPITGQPRFIMRRLRGPDGAIDFRILGEPGAPAILSLIGADGHTYSDYTYNGHDADLDVSHGGLNLRPLDGTGSINVWSMTGNTRLRVGSRDFGQSLDFWHSGENAHVRATTGNVVVESPIETRAGAVLRGDTFIDGVLRTRPATPVSSSARCEPGQSVSDREYAYFCTAPNEWKRIPLSTF